MTKIDLTDHLPDIRDGLTRKERIVLDCLNELEQTRGNRHVPTSMLYGRVLEKLDMSVDEMQAILQKLSGHF